MLNDKEDDDAVVTFGFKMKYCQTILTNQSIVAIIIAFLKRQMMEVLRITFLYILDEVLS